MKEQYGSMTIEWIRFGSGDVIRTSGPSGSAGGDIEMPEMPLSSTWSFTDSFGSEARR